MISFKTYSQELHESQRYKQVSKTDLSKLESKLDKLYAQIDIDVEFSKHFFDRVNDERNKKQITIAELALLFKDAFKKYKDTFVKHGKQVNMSDRDWQAVLNSISDDINLPFVLQWNKRDKEIELVAKTVLRKKGFKTSNRILNV